MHARRRVPKSLPAQAHEGAAMTMGREDRVLVEALPVEALGGVYAHERDAKQPLLFDIALPYDNRVPAASDAVEDAVDYAAVCTRVRAQVEALQPQLLETLAEAIATDLLQAFRVAWVRVRIRKPVAAQALGAASVGVEIVRHAGR